MFQFGDYNLGLLVWPFENDFVFVKPPKDNLPLLNDYIRLVHLLNLAILNCEREWGLLPLKQEEEPFGILKERTRLWPRTISAKFQASTYWDYFAVLEEIEQRVLHYVLAHGVRQQSGQDSAMKSATAA